MWSFFMLYLRKLAKTPEYKTEVGNLLCFVGRMFSFVREYISHALIIIFPRSLSLSPAVELSSAHSADLDEAPRDDGYVVQRVAQFYKQYSPYCQL